MALPNISPATQRNKIVNLFIIYGIKPKKRYYLFIIIAFMPLNYHIIILYFLSFFYLDDAIEGIKNPSVSSPNIGR